MLKYAFLLQRGAHRDEKQFLLLTSSQHTAQEAVMSSHGEPQLLGGSQVADSEWPPDMVVSCE